MGLLTTSGAPLEWLDARRYAHFVRTHGIRQFLATYARHQHCRGPPTLLWGDEVEYMLVHLDHSTRRATLSLRGADILAELEKEETLALERSVPVDVLWRPEYSCYMLEATPGSPYGLQVNELLMVETNMRLRRIASAPFLAQGEHLFTICSFPLLGVLEGNIATFLKPSINMIDGRDHCSASSSLFIPDEAISPHPRFGTLTKNIRTRRTEKVAINVPVYKDKNTMEPFIDQKIADAYSVNGPAIPGHIYMDAMCFGMGCCCLQVTLQASHICEARVLYDQLAVLTPILLALSAASPIFRGTLADVDCRWDVIAASVDDRSRVERGLLESYSMPVDRWNGNKFVKVPYAQRVIPKSRYDSISTYISIAGSPYNDLDLVIDQEIYENLISENLDPLLARHLAHLFIRDPLVIYQGLLDQDDSSCNDHFENIQSTNWQTMRFKPPPTTSTDLGWRVEFRAMEVQLTDFENAAYSVFTVLLSRLILCMDLHLYIPLSLVDDNMRTAQGRDAVIKGLFWFRHSIYSPSTKRDNNNSSAPSTTNEVNPTTTTTTTTTTITKVESLPCTCSSFATRSRSASPPSDPRQSLRIIRSVTNKQIKQEENNLKGIENFNKSSKIISDEFVYGKYTIDAIINGSEETVGLIPALRSYLDSLEIDLPVRKRLDVYINFISDRAAGRISTAANWIRQRSMQHPEYKKDSKITPNITYDLLMEVKALEGNFPIILPVLYN